MSIELCPRCYKNEYVTYEASPELRQKAIRHRILPPALSRVDSHTDICSDCGTHEAIQDMTAEGVTPKADWPIRPWPIEDAVIIAIPEED